MAHGLGGESGGHDFGFMALVVESGLEKAPIQRSGVKRKNETECLCCPGLPKVAQGADWGLRSKKSDASKERGEAKNGTEYQCCRGSQRDAAVAKVPPLMGCVKYKAQHIVLAVGIPLFMRC